MLPGSIGPMTSVFTKIIEGELPGRFVYRDADVAAFLTIAPVAYGHTLVVPVKEVDRWTDLEPRVWLALNTVAQQIGSAVTEAFGAPRAGYLIAGFEVPHAHIHVFPAHDMSDFDLARAMSGDEVDDAQMDAAAEKIREQLRAAGVDGVADGGTA